jgi:hypothetical protein
MHLSYMVLIPFFISPLAFVESEITISYEQPGPAVVPQEHSRWKDYYEEEKAKQLVEDPEDDPCYVTRLPERKRGRNHKQEHSDDLPAAAQDRPGKNRYKFSSTAASGRSNQQQTSWKGSDAMSRTGPSTGMVGDSLDDARNGFLHGESPESKEIAFASCSEILLVNCGLSESTQTILTAFTKIAMSWLGRVPKI